MVPPRTAQLVLDAIRRGRFWVLTHQEYKDVVMEIAEWIVKDIRPSAARSGEPPSGG